MAYKQSPEYTRRQVLRKYNMDEDDFKEMLDDQDGRCPICLGNIEGRTEGGVLLAHIDHDHETRLVRGLLCTNCNKGLGFLKDNIRYLARAIVYLEDHGKTF